MPAKRELTIRQIRQIVRLVRDGVSAREIGRLLGVARSTIQDDHPRAEAARLAWPLSFAHVLERGGMRRTWLRGRENVHKRYLVHVAGYNLGILMRALFGAGTPKEMAAIRNAVVFIIHAQDTIAIVVVAVFDAEIAALVIAIARDAV